MGVQKQINSFILIDGFDIGAMINDNRQRFKKNLTWKEVPPRTCQLHTV